MRHDTVRVAEESSDAKKRSRLGRTKVGDPMALLLNQGSLDLRTKKLTGMDRIDRIKAMQKSEC